MNSIQQIHAGLQFLFQLGLGRLQFRDVETSRSNDQDRMPLDFSDIRFKAHFCDQVESWLVHN